jgi:hypothetical protein
MSRRGWKPTAEYESTVPAEPLLDPIVVEESQSNGSFPDPRCTNESDGFETFSESDELIENVVASETGSRRRGRQFTRKNAAKT